MCPNEVTAFSANTGSMTKFRASAQVGDRLDPEGFGAHAVEREIAISLRVSVGYVLVIASGGLSAVQNVAFLVLLSLAVLLDRPAMAQMSATPPEIATALRKMGPRITRDIVGATAKLYAPLLAKMPTEGVKVIPDKAYGPDPRNKLDVYRPENSRTKRAPIVVFLHGGGFVRGDKKRYANLGTYFARHGVIGMMANYRFAPKNKWPSGAEDIALMIKWIRKNAATFGGDARRVFLMGASAGATHVAGYVFFERFHVNNDGVGGAILVSGPAYDLKAKLTSGGKLSHSGERGYFGEDASKYDDMSSIRNLPGRKIPIFVAYAELDPAPIQAQNMMLIEGLFERDKMLPTVKEVIGHNHISIIRHFNTGDQSLGPDILAFIAAQKGRRAR